MDLSTVLGSAWARLDHVPNRHNVNHPGIPSADWLTPTHPRLEKESASAGLHGADMDTGIKLEFSQEGRQGGRVME